MFFKKPMPFHIRIREGTANRYRWNIYVGDAWKSNSFAKGFELESEAIEDAHQIFPGVHIYSSKGVRVW